MAASGVFYKLKHINISIRSPRKILLPYSYIHRTNNFSRAIGCVFIRNNVHFIVKRKFAGKFVIRIVAYGKR